MEIRIVVINSDGAISQLDLLRLFDDGSSFRVDLARGTAASLCHHEKRRLGAPDRIICLADQEVLLDLACFDEVCVLWISRGIGVGW
jgi:hypothetical protein